MPDSVQLQALFSDLGYRAGQQIRGRSSTVDSGSAASIASIRIRCQGFDVIGIAPSLERYRRIDGSVCCFYGSVGCFYSSASSISGRANRQNQMWRRQQIRWILQTPRFKALVPGAFCKEHNTYFKPHCSRRSICCLQEASSFR